MALHRESLGKDEVKKEEMREASTECYASTSGVTAPVGAHGPGRRSDEVVFDRCLALAIISTLVLLALGYISHCAYQKKTALPKALRSA